MRGCFCITIFSFLVLSSCNYHIVKSPGMNSKPVQFNANTTVDAAVVQDAVLNSCVRCHGGGAMNLSTMDSIEANIAKVEAKVYSNEMPPANSGYSPLTDCQKDILQEWIYENMPTKSTHKVMDLASCKKGIPAPAPTPPPILSMPLNYQTLASQILQPRCIHCHRANGPDPDAADVLLYPYSEMASHKKIFGTGSADSKLYKLVTSAKDDRMPPPEDSGPLSSDEIEFIRRWLDAGHPEN